MANRRSFVSESGVRVADDFRDNLIIDRYDPLFNSMRASKLKHLRSENSEDAVTWNVFRSLRQIDPTSWLPQLSRRGLPGMTPLPPERTEVNLWVTANPPAGLLLDGDEGPSEIDIVIEAPSWVWFIEAKYRSDVSSRTTTRPTRDQILRNIDVGSYYAGVREFYFSLLVACSDRSPLGAEIVARYQDLSLLRELLRPHRPDGLSNLRAVTILTWGALGAVLDEAAKSAWRKDERAYAERALSWLGQKGLLQDGA